MRSNNTAKTFLSPRSAEPWRSAALLSLLVACLGRPPAVGVEAPSVCDRAPDGLLTEVELVLVKAGTPIPCNPGDPFGQSCPIAIPRGYSTLFDPGQRLVYPAPIAPGTYTVKVTSTGTSGGAPAVDPLHLGSAAPLRRQALSACFRC